MNTEIIVVLGIMFFLLLFVGCAIIDSAKFIKSTRISKAELEYLFGHSKIPSEGLNKENEVNT